MRVLLSATSRFHFFDLAKQLAERHSLAGFFTGYPRWKIKEERTLNFHLRTYPWIHTGYMATQRFRPMPAWLSESIDLIDRISFDAHVAKNLTPTDVFTAISGCGLQSGDKAKKMGARYVCDRGSTHISFQNDIMQREHREWRIPFTPTHPKIVERELAEYESADLVTVPSFFARETFLKLGVPDHKVKVIPYGVDLQRFEPSGAPGSGEFIVAFAGGVSLRKGIQYLVQAFARVSHRRKALWLIGQVDHRLVDRLTRLKLIPRETVFMGHIDQAQLKHYLSRASVLVLPSVEDGFGLVMAQAMACACPVIASSNTGAAEVISEGRNGYIVPAGSVEALADALQRVADSSAPQTMRAAALESVRSLGGWQHYGDQVMEAYRSLCGAAR